MKLNLFFVHAKYCLAIFLIVGQLFPSLALAVDPDSRSAENSGSDSSDVGPVGDPGFGPTGSYDGDGASGGDPDAGADPDTDGDGTSDSAEGAQNEASQDQAQAAADARGVDVSIGSVDTSQNSNLSNDSVSINGVAMSLDAALDAIDAIGKATGNGATSPESVGISVDNTFDAYAEGAACDGCVVGAMTGVVGQPQDVAHAEIDAVIGGAVGTDSTFDTGRFSSQQAIDGSKIDALGDALDAQRQEMEQAFSVTKDYEAVLDQVQENYNITADEIAVNLSALAETLNREFGVAAARADDRSVADNIARAIDITKEEYPDVETFIGTSVEGLPEEQQQAINAAYDQYEKDRLDNQYQAERDLAKALGDVLGEDAYDRVSVGPEPDDKDEESSTGRSLLSGKDDNQSQSTVPSNETSDKNSASNSAKQESNKTEFSYEPTIQESVKSGGSKDSQQSEANSPGEREPGSSAENYQELVEQRDKAITAGDIFNELFGFGSAQASESSGNQTPAAEEETGGALNQPSTNASGANITNVSSRSIQNLSDAQAIVSGISTRQISKTDIELGGKMLAGELSGPVTSRIAQGRATAEDIEAVRTMVFSMLNRMAQSGRTFGEEVKRGSNAIDSNGQLTTKGGQGNYSQNPAAFNKMAADTIGAVYGINSSCPSCVDFGNTSDPHVQGKDSKAAGSDTRAAKPTSHTAASTKEAVESRYTEDLNRALTFQGRGLSAPNFNEVASLNSTNLSYGFREGTEVSSIPAKETAQEQTDAELNPAKQGTNEKQSGSYNNPNGRSGFASNVGFGSGVNSDNLSSAMRSALNEIANAIPGIPVNVNSGYRSSGHNAKVGGAKQSQHILGRAVDIELDGLTTAQQKAVVEAALNNAKVNGFGYYHNNNTIHIDARLGSSAYWGRGYNKADFDNQVKAGLVPDWLSGAVYDWASDRTVSIAGADETVASTPVSQAVLDAIKKAQDLQARAKALTRSPLPGYDELATKQNAPAVQSATTQPKVTVLFAPLFGDFQRSIASLAKELRARGETVIEVGDDDDEAAKALEAVKAMGQNVSVNILGYSRGGFRGIEFSNDLAKAGINVEHLAAVEPHWTGWSRGGVPQVGTNVANFYEYRASIIGSWTQRYGKEAFIDKSQNTVTNYETKRAGLTHMDAMFDSKMRSQVIDKFTEAPAEAETVTKSDEQNAPEKTEKATADTSAETEESDDAKEAATAETKENEAATDEQTATVEAVEYDLLTDAATRTAEELGYEVDYNATKEARENGAISDRSIVGVDGVTYNVGTGIDATGSTKAERDAAFDANRADTEKELAALEASIKEVETQKSQGVTAAELAEFDKAIAEMEAKAKALNEQTLKSSAVNGAVGLETNGQVTAVEDGFTVTPFGNAVLSTDVTAKDGTVSINTNGIVTVTEKGSVITANGKDALATSGTINGRNFSTNGQITVNSNGSVTVAPIGNSLTAQIDKQTVRGDLTITITKEGKFSSSVNTVSSIDGLMGLLSGITTNVISTVAGKIASRNDVNAVNKATKETRAAADAVNRSIAEGKETAVAKDDSVAKTPANETVAATKSDETATSDAIANEDTVATAATSIEGLVSQVAQLQSQLQNKDLSNEQVAQIDQALTEAETAIEAYGKAIGAARAGKTQDAYDALASGNEARDKATASLDAQNEVAETAENRATPISANNQQNNDDQQALKDEAKTFADKVVSSVKNSPFGRAITGIKNAVEDFLGRLTGKKGTGKGGGSVDDDGGECANGEQDCQPSVYLPVHNTQLARIGGTDDPAPLGQMANDLKNYLLKLFGPSLGTAAFALFPSTLNSSLTGAGNSAVSNQDEGPKYTVPVEVTINKMTGATDMTVKEIVEHEVSENDQTTEAEYESGEDGELDQYDYQNEVPLVLNEFGEIVYSNGTYAPIIENGVVYEDPEVEYVYVIKTISENGLVKIPDNAEALPGGILTALKRAVSNTGEFELVDVVNIERELIDPDSEVPLDEYYTYRIELSDRTSRSFSIPEYTSFAFMREGMTNIGYQGNVLELLGKADDVVNENKDGLLGNVAGYISGTLGAWLGNNSNTGQTSTDLSGVTPATDGIFNEKDIKEVSIYTGVEAECPNVPGLDQAYIYEVVVSQSSIPDAPADGVIRELRCGTGSPLTYSYEVGAHLERVHGFASIEPEVLLKFITFNFYNAPANVDEVVAVQTETQAVEPVATTTEIVIPNTTNEVSFEVMAVDNSGNVLTDWIYGDLEISTGVQLFFRWNGGSYAQCLPFLNDNGLYSLTRVNDPSLNTGNTETESYNIREGNMTYRIECGGQENGETGVDIREVNITIGN